VKGTVTETHPLARPAPAEATIRALEMVADLVVQSEPKPEPTSCPAEGYFTSAEPDLTVENADELRAIRASGPADGHSTQP
jgi:hypothetical protein